MICVLNNYTNLCHFIDKKNWAINKFAKPKSYQNIIFEMIIPKTQLIELEIFCFIFFKEILKKKKGLS